MYQFESKYANPFKKLQNRIIIPKKALPNSNFNFHVCPLPEIMLIMCNQYHGGFPFQMPQQVLRQPVSLNAI